MTVDEVRIPLDRSVVGVVPGGEALLIVNPTAGGVTRQLCTDVEACCVGAGLRATVLTTSRRGSAIETVADAVRAEARSGLGLVVAVGGDGTVREVAEGLARGLGRWPSEPGDRADARPPLLVVPAGTGNSVYRALWGDAAWPEVVERALVLGQARVRDLDLARLGQIDRAVLLGLSAGLTARVTELAAGQRHVPGRDRYWSAAATALAELAPFPAEVHVDGVALHTGPVTLVAVGGGRHRAGIFQLLPHSVLDDGRLDVCVVGKLADADVATFAALIPAGEHLERPEVSYLQGSSVTMIRTDGRPLLAEHDGDMLTDVGDRMSLDVVPGAVPVLAPVSPLAG